VLLGTRFVAFAALAAVLVATAGFLVRARHADKKSVIRGAAYPAADEAPGVRGWTWSHGQPGFVPVTGHERWNIAQVGEHELDGPRFDARLTPVRPETVKLLAANRIGPRDLELLLSGSDAHGATCIGASLPARHTDFFCPSSSGSRRLGPQVAFVIVAAGPRFFSRGKPEFPFFVEGVARGDVTGVVSAAPSIDTFVSRDGATTTRARSFVQTAYDRGAGWWGTFGSTFTNAYLHRMPTRPWRVHLTFYGAQGVLATLDVRLNRPGERLYAVTP